MKLLQKKRNTFRLQIRRKEIQCKMSSIRLELTQDLYYNNCIKHISQILSSNPQMLFNELHQYFKQTLDIQKVPFASAIWSYLTSLHFYQRKYHNNGLPHLLVTIYPFLGQDKKWKLSQLKILQELLYNFYSNIERQNDEPSQLFDIIFQLCVYASRQSKFVLDFSQWQIQKIIKMAHSELSKPNLQILSLTLLNLQRDSIRNCLKPKLKQITRILYRRTQNYSNQRKLELRLLALIGYHLGFEQRQKEVINLLLKQNQDIQFPLLLKFVNTQAQESFLNYSDIKKFLQNCPTLLNGQSQTNQLIYTITNILEKDFNTEDLLQIYNMIFAGKMQTFIRIDTVNPMAKLVFWLFMIKDNSLTNELINCGLKILEIGATEIQDENILISLSIDLIVHEGCTDEELLALIGEQMYGKVWDHYANQNDIFDSI